MKWELHLSSSLVTTLLVLLLDVVALWLLDTALLRVAAYLNARAVYDARKSIKISDVWFESVSGRSHGPVWFRAAQVALKLLMFTCSIAVRLSIDGFTKYRQVRVPNQTVLVRQDRRMSEIGIGGHKNFSSDVMFVQSSASCSFRDRDTISGLENIVRWNVRALAPNVIGHRKFDRMSSLQCLSVKNGFSVRPVNTNVPNIHDTQDCAVSTPNVRQIKLGRAAVSVSRCPWRLTHFHCQAIHLGGCALTLELGQEQVLFIKKLDGRLTSTTFSVDNSKTWRNRSEETKYVDFGMSDTSAFILDHITSFQAGTGNITEVKGSFSTRINVRIFLAGFGINLTIVSVFIAFSLVSHVIMVRKNRPDYGLGLRVAEVALFARMKTDDIQDESLFVRQHPDFPRLTVSGVPENCGTWDKDEFGTASRLNDSGDDGVDDESTLATSE